VQYNASRVVVEHESQPWASEEFKLMKPYHLSIVCNVNDRNNQPTDCTVCWNLQWVVGDRARVARCECKQCEDVESLDQRYIATPFSDYDDIIPKETKEMSEHQYLICMSHMYGFILKDRTYGILHTS
jgi:hypothetical protein